MVVKRIWARAIAATILASAGGIGLVLPVGLIAQIPEMLPFVHPDAWDVYSLQAYWAAKLVAYALGCIYFISIGTYVIILPLAKSKAGAAFAVIGLMLLFVVGLPLLMMAAPRLCDRIGDAGPLMAILIMIVVCAAASARLFIWLLIPKRKLV